MLNHEQVLEILPDYALDNLTEDDAVAVSEHLVGCAVCRAELQIWQNTVDQLALAVPVAAVPDDLHRRLMARIASPKPQPATVQQNWLTWLRRSAPAWGAVAVLLLVGLFASNLSLRQQLTQHEQNVAPMAAIPMVCDDPADPASGVVVVSADGEYGTLVVQHLPELSTEQVYQLWLIQNGQRTDGGTFSVDEHGYTAVEIEAPQDLALYDAFGVTIEPTGGSPGPTGPKVLGSP